MPPQADASLLRAGAAHVDGWTLFDDETAEQLSEEEVRARLGCGDAPSILFYCRRDDWISAR